MSTLKPEEAKAILAKLRAEADLRLAKLRAEIEKAEMHGTPAAIQLAKDELSKFRNVFDRSLARAQTKLDEAEIADLERRTVIEAEDKKRAGQAEAKAKEKAFRAFFAAGGERADFELQWPSIYQELLKDKVKDSFSNGDGGTKTNISNL